MIERRFKVLRDQSCLSREECMAWPESLPWSMVELWRERIEENHGQTLERLDERGGLSPQELWHSAVAKHLSDRYSISEHEAGEWLKSLPG